MAYAEGNHDRVRKKVDSQVQGKQDIIKADIAYASHGVRRVPIFTLTGAVVTAVYNLRRGVSYRATVCSNDMVFTPLISLSEQYIPTLVTYNFILAIEYVRVYLFLALCS